MNTWGTRMKEFIVPAIQEEVDRVEQFIREYAARGQRSILFSVHNISYDKLIRIIDHYEIHGYKVKVEIGEAPIALNVVDQIESPIVTGVRISW